MEPLSVDVVQHGEHALVTISGELDGATAGMLQAIDVSMLAQAGCRDIAVDLTGLAFMDSSGIGSLVSLHNRAAAIDMTTTVSTAPAHIRHTLTVTGLADLFGLTH